MKSKILTTGLLIGFLVGCNETQQNTIDYSKREPSQAPTVKIIKPSPSTKSKATEINEFDSVSFPQDSCGDQLPNDLKAYPVKHYPVFIDYSESNLKSVKSKYCHDAFKKNRKTAGKNSIQVASFLSIERANKFRNFMIKKLGSGEVAEPTVIQAKRTSQETEASLSTQVGKAAQLSPNQIQKLVSIVGESKDFLHQSVVVVPTYIPDGFKVTEFRVWKQKHQSKDLTGGHYEIVYENNSEVCFTIGGGVIAPMGDEPENFEEIKIIHSPALGSVEVGFTKSSRVNGSNLVAFVGSLDRISRGKNEYRFASPVRFLMDSSVNNEHLKSCKMMSLQDAKRVVQSLQFLRP